MNKWLTALLLWMGMSAVSCALAAQNTYVFPYEGLRYTQQEGETVLTQTNLAEHADLIASLGTTADAILSSYMAAGIVMEVIPQDGGQIAVSVADAGAFAGAGDMAALSEEELAAFLAQYEDSGLYEDVSLTDTEPRCVRMTSSAMYGSMPVYTVRYATLYLSRLCVLTQTVVGRAPEEADDAQLERVLSGIRFLSAVSEPTPSPTPAPTATPEPTPVPTPGVAEVIASEGEMTVEGVPSFTQDPDITITGRTGASREVTVRVGDKTLGRTTAGKDGSFALRVTLPQGGNLTLAVMTDTDEQMLSVNYQMPRAKLVITGPEETTFTGTNIIVRGETEPNAKVFVEADGFKTNVEANKNGAFSVRLFMDEGTMTYALRTKPAGFGEARAEITLTRELTEREWIAEFRTKRIYLDYDVMVTRGEEFKGRQLIERGMVMEFADYDGQPCALVCIANPNKGVWTNPIWIVMDKDDQIAAGDIITMYLICEGLTLPADDQYFAGGVAEHEAPVFRLAHWSEGR